jgi:MFS family permease
MLAGLSLAMAFWTWQAVPASVDRRTVHAPSGLGHRVGRTLRAGGAWLASAAFACYSAQWLAVIGFLPTIYAQAGISGSYAAIATAFAAAVNMVGNIASGRLLKRGVPASLLIQCGYVAMLLGSFLAFAPWPGSGPMLRYSGVLLFSTLGGLVPGTLFSLAVRVAPDDSTVSTTVGWMQQWSSLGQFVGPPVAAWTAVRVGDWHATWWVTGGFAVLGMAVAAAISRLLAAHSTSTAAPRTRT